MPSIVELAELSRAVYDLKKRVIVEGGANSCESPAQRVHQRMLPPTMMRVHRTRPDAACEISLPTVWCLARRWNPRLSGFTAALYARDGDSPVLAFAGTHELLDYFDDAVIVGHEVPPQARHAIVAAHEASGLRNLYLTGHSLGGALAIIAAAHTGRAAVTFNAPGVMDSCVRSGHQAPIGSLFSVVSRCINGPRLRNIRIFGDPVSSYLTTGMQSGTTLPDYSAWQCGLDPFCRHGSDTCITEVRRNPQNFQPLSL